MKRLTAADPHDAWLAWNDLGLQDFGDSTDFAANLGAALADERPLSFAVKRGSFHLGPGPDRPAFEAQPEPMAEHSDTVLVRTVGGALALQMWQYHDVGTEEFPDDFAAWWQAYAASRLLPPMPEG